MRRAPTLVSKRAQPSSASRVLHEMLQLLFDSSNTPSNYFQGAAWRRSRISRLWGIVSSINQCGNAFALIPPIGENDSGQRLLSHIQSSCTINVFGSIASPQPHSPCPSEI